MTLVRTHTHWSAWLVLGGCLGALAAPASAAELKGALGSGTELFQPAKESSPVVHTTQPVRPFIRPLFAAPVKQTISSFLQSPWKETQESSTDPSRTPDDLFGDPIDEFVFDGDGFDDIAPLVPESSRGVILPGASSPVPAPGSLVLFGLGAAAGLRRRRR